MDVSGETLITRTLSQGVQADEDVRYCDIPSLLPRSPTHEHPNLFRYRQSISHHFADPFEEIEKIIPNLVRKGYVGFVQIEFYSTCKETKFDLFDWLDMMELNDEMETKAFCCNILGNFKALLDMPLEELATHIDEDDAEFIKECLEEDQVHLFYG